MHPHTQQSPTDIIDDNDNDIIRNIVNLNRVCIYLSDRCGLIYSLHGIYKKYEDHSIDDNNDDADI